MRNYNRPCYTGYSILFFPLNVHNLRKKTVFLFVSNVWLIFFLFRNVETVDKPSLNKWLDKVVTVKKCMSRDMRCQSVGIANLYLKGFVILVKIND